MFSGTACVDTKSYVIVSITEHLFKSVIDILCKLREVLFSAIAYNYRYDSHIT